MRVMVTRPLADAAPLVERLLSEGHEILLEPLLSIQMRAAPALDLSEFQAVLLTSANGARALAEHTAEHRILVICVGAATADTARSLGFTQVISVDGDVDTLVTFVIGRCNPSDSPLLHVAGSVVAGDMTGRLQAVGFVVRREILYDAVPSQALSPDACFAITRGKLDAVMLYSPRTAAQFATLIEEAELSNKSGGMDALCLSAAVADALGDLPVRRKLIARRPNQDALLDLIGGALG